jgi:hypothetical protein
MPAATYSCRRAVRAALLHTALGVVTSPRRNQRLRIDREALRRRVQLQASSSPLYHRKVTIGLRPGNSSVTILGSECRHSWELWTGRTGKAAFQWRERRSRSGRRQSSPSLSHPDETQAPTPGITLSLNGLPRAGVSRTNTAAWDVKAERFR